MRKALLFSLLAVATLATSPALAANITYPDAPGPDPDHIIVPPRENSYFFVRPDGQPVMIQTDISMNATEAISRKFYDFKWRGEVWSPWDFCTQVEKASRLMATWPEYYAATQGRVFTGWHEFWEKWSGFGPQ